MNGPHIYTTIVSNELAIVGLYNSLPSSGVVMEETSVYGPTATVTALTTQL